MSALHEVPSPNDQGIVIELDREERDRRPPGIASETWQRRALYLTDVVTITIAWTWIVILTPTPRPVTVVALAAASAVMWLALHGMYRVGSTKNRTHETSHLYGAALLSAVVVAVTDTRPGQHLEPTALVAGIVLGGGLLQLGRHFYRNLLTHAHHSGNLLRPAVLAGAPADLGPVAARLRSQPELGYSIAAIVEHPEPAPLARLACAVGAESVILVPGGYTAEQMARLVRGTTNAGLHVHVVGGMSGIDARRVKIRPLGRDVCVHVDRVCLDGWQVAVKRACDLFLSIAGLIVFAPLFLVVAAAIKLGDRGPVLFRQERVGRDDVPFVMYKFRSMVVDAETRLAEVQAANQRVGPLFKAANDPRVTRIGRILRATSIDELPQLINVLKGQMSIVGPRPALANEVASFSPELRRRHCVLPGITGLWQVEGRDDPDFAVYEETDIFYVENWSVMLDTLIILRTVWVLVRRVFRKVVRRAVPAVVLD